MEAKKSLKMITTKEYLSQYDAKTILATVGALHHFPTSRHVWGVQALVTSAPTTLE